MSDDIQIPDPFEIPKQIELSAEEIGYLKELILSAGWAVAKRIYDWQQKKLTAVMYNMPPEQAAKLPSYQGVIKGIALARRSVEDVESYVPSKAAEHNIRDKETEFYEKWPNAERSTKSSSTGY